MNPTTYDQFCALRDKRRAGEEAPEHTEKRAFEIAVLTLVSTPAPMSDEHKSRERQNRADIVRRAVKRGDVLTHTGCMGCLFEHEFIGWDGNWMRGRPTRDTFRFERKTGPRGATYNQADDIGPANVTHINRVPVEAIAFLAEAAPRSLSNAAAGIEDTTYGN